MIAEYIRKLIWFIVLVLLQVLVLNNISIGGYATPFFYIYFILKFDSSTSVKELMIWAFFLGLSIDVFSNSLGMHAASAVFLAFMRNFLLRLFTPRDKYDNLVPALNSMGGFVPFLKYVLVGAVCHHAVLLSLEFFSFVNLSLLLLRIVLCALFTTICILSVEGFRK